MASTSMKNTHGNYALEQLGNSRQFDFNIYQHSAYGQATQVNLPGDGLLPARMTNLELANNPEDIESFLFGIGSTNLVDPKPKFVASLKERASLAVYKKPDVILPRPLTVHNNQREYLN